MRRDELDGAIEARALLYAPLVSQALCSVAELGIRDLVGDRARTVVELAGLTGAHEPSLRQVMTALTALDVLTAQADDRFALARVGSALVSDAPGSAAASALMALEMTGRAWQGIPGTVRTGVPAFETEFGADFFGHLDKRSDLRRSSTAPRPPTSIWRSRPSCGCMISSTGTLVDLGGGDGALLARLLETYTQLHGVLVDRPNAVASAGVRLKEAGSPPVPISADGRLLPGGSRRGATSICSGRSCTTGTTTSMCRGAARLPTCSAGEKGA